MELDKTAIAITQRNLDELLDLGLSVLRRYGLQLIKPAFVGVLPFAILNTLLLWSRSTLGGAIPDPQGWPHILLLWLMGILVYVEAPLAMAGVTIVLGNTMFGITNTPGTVIETLKKQSKDVLWVMGFVRGIVPLISLIAFLEFSGINQAYVDSAGMFWVFLISLLIVAIRSFRPYAPEILLLERCKLKPEKSAQTKTSLIYPTRSARLHSASGELFGIAFFMGIVASVFLLILNLSATFMVGSLTGQWSWGWWMDLILYPMALWILAFWATIMRFLVYMNMRIRGEGWELELKLKAEARRYREAKERSYAK
ncbi:MAG: hypothetical protein ACK449_13835 [Planctomycetota bacterium]|jgi:hypothetical protein